MKMAGVDSPCGGAGGLSLKLYAYGHKLNPFLLLGAPQTLWQFVTVQRTLL